MILKIEDQIKQIQQNHSLQERDRLLEELEPQVCRIASKISKRTITRHDEEYSITFGALDEAISIFNQSKNSSFLSFVYVITKRRLVDYYRQQKRHYLHSFPFLAEEVGEGAQGYSALVQASFKKYYEEEMFQSQRLEIDMLLECLAKHKISLFEVTNERPKHRDTREKCYDLARTIAKETDILKIFYERKKINQKVIQTLGINRRFLYRYRNYLIVLTIVLLEDFPLLRNFVGMNLEG